MMAASEQTSISLAQLLADLRQRSAISGQVLISKTWIPSLDQSSLLIPEWYSSTLISNRETQEMLGQYAGTCSTKDMVSSLQEHISTLASPVTCIPRSAEWHG